MDAMLCGQLGVAYLTRGEMITSISVLDPQEEVETSWANFAFVVNSTPDARHLENVRKEDVAKELLSEWKADRCLQLLFMLFDESQKRSLKESAAKATDEFLLEEEIKRKVENRFYSCPLPAGYSFATPWMYAEDYDHFAEFLREVEMNQNFISRLVEAWNAIPIDFFESDRRKLEVREWLVQRGCFRDFALALTDRIQFDKHRLEYQLALKETGNSKQIMDFWLEDLRPVGRKRELVEDEPVHEEANLSTGTGATHEKKSSRKNYQVYRTVNELKKPIFEFIKLGDGVNAINYTKPLIQYQLNNGGREYASMTLCHLAQRAKDAYYHNLQHEFVKWAVAIHPTDGWAHSQLADAYICLGRFDEALAEFEKSKAYGEGGFASVGIARIHHRRGDLLKALELYSQSKLDYPEEVSAWYGIAEVNRDMCRWDAALSAYEESIDLFPDERVGYCGKASVLTDVGRFSEARKTYEKVLELFGDDPVASGGIAKTYSCEGDFDEAIKILNDALKVYPNEPRLLAGRAETWRSMGQFDNARRDYEVGIELFENQPVFWSGLAEVYRTEGDLFEAASRHQVAIDRFPFEPWSWNGKANVFKLQHRYEESLQLYDNAAKKFPYNVVSHSGRADLLKNLGMLDEAIEAYRSVRIITNDANVDHAIASILGAQGKLEEALELLGAMPRYATTKNDWIANHVYGMILLRSGRVQDAAKVFETGLNHCGWVKENKYFRNALAIAKIKAEEYASAVELVEEPETPVELILSIHANGLAGNAESAKDAYEKLKDACPPVFVGLRDDLVALHFEKQENPKTHNRIYDELCVGALLFAA